MPKKKYQSFIKLNDFIKNEFDIHFSSSRERNIRRNGLKNRKL